MDFWMRSNLALEQVKRINGDVVVSLRDVEIDALKLLAHHCRAPLIIYRRIERLGVAGRRRINYDTTKIDVSMIFCWVGGSSLDFLWRNDLAAFDSLIEIGKRSARIRNRFRGD